MALRPRLSPCSIASRNGSQALTDGMGLGVSSAGSLKCTPNPVVTPLAAFEVPVFAFTLLGGFSGLWLTAMAVFTAPDPVVTWVGSLAAFAGGRRPHAPDGRTPIPAALRYLPAVSRRTPVSCSMRRKGHPSRPRAITCCLLSSLKALLIPTKVTVFGRKSTSQASFSLAAFQVTLIGRFWVTPEVKSPERNNRCLGVRRKIGIHAR